MSWLLLRSGTEFNTKRWYHNTKSNQQHPQTPNWQGWEPLPETLRNIQHWPKPV